jgi:hypothetical protein
MSDDQMQAPQWLWTPPTAAVEASANPAVPVRTATATPQARDRWSAKQRIVALAAAVVIAGLGSAAVAWGDNASTTGVNGRGGAGGFGNGGGFGGNRFGPGGTAGQGGAVQGGFGQNGTAPAAGTGS